MPGNSTPLSAQELNLIIETNTEHRIIVIDDFLADPDAARDLALRTEYHKDPIYPGYRSTRVSLLEQLGECFEKLIGQPIFSLESLFQYQTAENEGQSFIHGDPCNWAGVLYLSKDHDGEPGTSFYRHQATGQTQIKVGADLMFEAIEKKVEPIEIVKMTGDDRMNSEKWDCRYTVPIRYNRLALYNARQFHRNGTAWGSEPANARLIQGFFIATEKSATLKSPITPIT